MGTSPLGKRAIRGDLRGFLWVVEPEATEEGLVGLGGLDWAIPAVVELIWANLAGGNWLLVVESFDRNGIVMPLLTDLSELEGITRAEPDEVGLNWLLGELVGDLVELPPVTVVLVGRAPGDDPTFHTGGLSTLDEDMKNNFLVYGPLFRSSRPFWGYQEVSRSYLRIKNIQESSSHNRYTNLPIGSIILLHWN